MSARVRLLALLLASLITSLVTSLALGAAAQTRGGPPVRPPAEAGAGTGDAGADPGEALQRQLSARLPGGWKVSLPQNYLGVEQVTVQIPDAWRGSPATAAMALCPDPDSTVWRGLSLLRLVVQYHGREWPPYDCRP